MAHWARTFLKTLVLAYGTQQGVTIFRITGYGDPYSPDRIHRYFFKLYSLDTAFNLPCNLTGKRRLLASIKAHILAEAELMGKYERKAKLTGDK